MDLRKEILKEHSKAQCEKIVDWVGSDQKRFDSLFECFMHDEYRVVQRAAWPISYCVVAHPQFIKKHWSRFFKNLQQPDLHNAVKRNSVRLLQDIDIPKKYHGIAMDLCFKMLQDPAEPVAVKVFSMTVLDRLSITYPDIRPELKLMIKEQYSRQTTGFQNRAGKVLKHMS